MKPIRTALEGLALKYREVLENLRHKSAKSLQPSTLLGEVPKMNFSIK